MKESSSKLSTIFLHTWNIDEMMDPFMRYHQASHTIPVLSVEVIKTTSALPKGLSSNGYSKGGIPNHLHNKQTYLWIYTSHKRVYAPRTSQCSICTHMRLLNDLFRREDCNVANSQELLYSSILSYSFIFMKTESAHTGRATRLL